MNKKMILRNMYVIRGLASLDNDEKEKMNIMSKNISRLIGSGFIYIYKGGKKNKYIPKNKDLIIQALYTLFYNKYYKPQ